MLNVHVVNERQDQQLEHAAGLLEFGRGPRQTAPRCVIDDAFVSRDHLQIEEMPDGRLRVRNLSQKQQLQLPDGRRLPSGTSSDLDLPLTLQIGNTTIGIEAVEVEAFDKSCYRTLSKPIRRPEERQQFTLGDLGEAPAPETIASWLETVLVLQQAPAGGREFYTQTARALVDLVGLDLGMVLLRGAKDWEIAGHHAAHSTISSRYSRTLLAHVLGERRTFYQDPTDTKLQADSLRNVDAVVAAPIFDLRDEVVGVLYGARTWRGRGGIRPLEAQLVQLLAGALGANLVRTQATRTRTQFEQFFSPELVRELERDASLLEGRHQEVTILFSDLRGCTKLSERLGPEVTCRVMRDVMEALTQRIVAQGGVVVDYAGDGILAMWNAPLPQADHVQRACRAALAMLSELPELNAKWQPTIETTLALGIGVNVGPALVGNTGSTRKLKYGPLGLTVNAASRIQDATKKVGVPLLIAESVRQQLPDIFKTRSVGALALAGISEEVVLHELCGEVGTLAA